jgi:hypothetical protein
MATDRERVAQLEDRPQELEGMLMAMENMLSNSGIRMR